MIAQDIASMDAFQGPGNLQILPLNALLIEMDTASDFGGLSCRQQLETHSGNKNYDVSTQFRA